MKHDRLEEIILNARLTCNDRELTLGFLRYESLRKLNLLNFSKLYHRNMKGKNFDEMVNELVVKNYIDKSAPKI